MTCRLRKRSYEYSQELKTAGVSVKACICQGCHGSQISVEGLRQT